MAQATRIERDGMGEIEVPADRYWGAQTARSLAFFAIGSERMPLPLIHALGLVKQVAAEVNGALGLLAPDKTLAISAAAAEIASGALDDEFPLRVWQTGSGTQTNMNANEVIANRASERLGGPRGVDRLVHPNDEVNRSQSSNDVFPTALHVAAAIEIERRLLPALAHLRAALGSRVEAFRGLLKMGRTHLMDAVPITLAQEFSGYRAQVEDGEARLHDTARGLLELAIGATAVGTGLGAPAGFGERVAAGLAERTGLAFRTARSPFAALAAHDAVVATSGAIRTLAGALMKIANDIRWMGSGPRGGLAELILPANEPGSSIMPGKVNPTQCEAMSMVCVQVFGNDAAIAIAGSRGDFELNVYKPLLAHALLQSIALLSDACRSFADHCVAGLVANEEQLRRNVERSLMLVTALTPHIGYDAAARAAKKAHTEGTSLREAVLALGLLDASRYDALVRPEAMVGPDRESHS